jgi:hypothetical protein
MSEATIRAAIYAAVNGVTNVGKVYDYERRVDTWDAFGDLFRTTIGSTVQIRGWMIGYRGIVNAEGSRFERGSKRVARTHRFQILGVMGIDDSAASEKTFAALAEDVCDALDSDSTIHAFMGARPVTLGFDPAPFAGVTVHAAAINIEITESV